MQMSFTLLNSLDGDSGISLGTLNPALPEADPALIALAPSTSDRDYATKAQEFVWTNVPNVWSGQRVGFLDTYENTVRYADAYPNGKGDPNLLSGFSLEVWGLPTSRPAIDPDNRNFVFQRFQRGIVTTQVPRSDECWN
jgi:hypothetical protein